MLVDASLDDVGRLGQAGAIRSVSRERVLTFLFGCETHSNKELVKTLRVSSKWVESGICGSSLWHDEVVLNEFFVSKHIA